MRKRTTPHVAARLDVNVRRPLLERVLPQPVDDVDDVAVVGIEGAFAAELDQLLEASRERDLPFRGLLRLFHRPGERVELAQEAPDVVRIGEDELHLELQHFLELVGPASHERFAGGDGERAARHLDRQNPVALGVGVRHRLRHRREIDLQRVDVQIRNAELAGEPFDEPVERERRMRRCRRLPLLGRDVLERVFAPRAAGACELVRVGRRHEAIGDHQLEDVLEAKAAVLRVRRRR